jgi:hypothetical protein
MPTSGRQRVLANVDRQALQLAGGSDAAVEKPLGVGAFGGVLGEVAGESFPADGGADDLEVELGASPQAPVVVGGDVGLVVYLPDGVDKVFEFHIGRGGVGGVEADGDVEVDQAACLELGDLGVLGSASGLAASCGLRRRAGGPGPGKDQPFPPTDQSAPRSTRNTESCCLPWGAISAWCA